MASILNNADAEALLLDIRTAGAAAGQVIDDGDGAFLLFPTSVVTACARGGQLVFPLQAEAEPGTVVRTDGTSEVCGTVAGVSVSGAFSWTLGDERPAQAPVVAPARYGFRRRGRDVAAPAWASQLPGSRCLAAVTPLSLDRHRCRLLRQGRLAEYWLLKLTERVVRQVCRGPMRRAIDHRPPVDVDDVVQRGMQVVSRLLPLYASSQRPPCSWLGMLRLDGRRDMHREISRLDWLPPEAAVVVALAAAAGVGPGSGPSATLAALTDAVERAGRRLPRVGPRQVHAALTAPPITPLEQLPAAYLDATVPRVELEVDGVEEQPGRVAAEVARLVSDDPALVALARQGDDVALGRVGAKVLAALGRGRESAAATRRRCWADFHDTGRLFDTDGGRQGLLPATAMSLAAIDEALRHAAGLAGRPATTW